MAYSKHNLLSKDKKEAKKIQRSTKILAIVRRQFVRTRDPSVGLNSLLYVHPVVVIDLVYELHEGLCDSYTSVKSLDPQAVFQGW